MNDLITVDFHIHSTVSDGTCSPIEVADLTRSLAAYSLTDHDCCAGLEACANASSNFIPGIELSIYPGEGFDRFHLLGYGIDYNNLGLNTFLERVRVGRDARNQEILNKFSKIGIDIPENELMEYTGGDVLARPHFARWLVDHKFASSVADAFDKYLLPNSPRETLCYVDRFRPTQEEAFDVIHNAGGICVMAHPKTWRRVWRSSGVDYKAAEKELRRLKDIGLDGLEALYQANTQEENVEFVRLAEKLRLIKTAGSDFHGANKPTVKLGMSVSKSFVAPFLERVL